MNANDLRPGMNVVTSGRLGYVTRVGEHHGQHGAWVSDSSGDYGTTPSLPGFVAAASLAPVVLGETVCNESRRRCGCRLAHVSDETLRYLVAAEKRRAEAGR